MSEMDEALVAAETFALERGWLSCPEWPFTTNFREFDDPKADDHDFFCGIPLWDLFDHTFYFRSDGGKPIAIVSHLYDFGQTKIDDVKEFALVRGLVVAIDVAPRWWHEKATSILWTPRPLSQHVVLTDLPTRLYQQVKYKRTIPLFFDNKEIGKLGIIKYVFDVNMKVESELEILFNKIDGQIEKKLESMLHNGGSIVVDSIVYPTKAHIIPAAHFTH